VIIVIGNKSTYIGWKNTLRMYCQKENPTKGAVMLDCANSEPKKLVAAKSGTVERYGRAKMAIESEMIAANALKIKEGRCFPGL
jgi:hypothetical protein